MTWKKFDKVYDLRFSRHIIPWLELVTWCAWITGPVSDVEAFKVSVKNTTVPVGRCCKYRHRGEAYCWHCLSIQLNTFPIIHTSGSRYFYAMTKHFHGAFTKLPWATISFVRSVRPSSRNNSAPTVRIFIKFAIWKIFENLSKKIKLH
jgi:hypothetical protein